MDENKKPRILIVDDEERNLKLMGALISSYGYSFETAKNGIEAIEKAKQYLPDLIYLDIMMPEMDGYETCRRLREDNRFKQTPIVMVTALTDRDSKLKGLEAGANDFLTKPFDASELIIRTKNLLRIKEYEDFLKDYNERLELEVRKRTEELRKSYLDTIQRLTLVAEYKDEETANHIRRVGHYCAIIAKNLGWPQEKVDQILYAAPMHDIGKVAIPAEILLKPAKLTPEEYALMKTHPVVGARILSDSPSPILQMAERIALSHHERWDGSGYPHGLRGEEIPLEGRIMILADQYDALRSRRPYRPPLPHEQVFKIITEGDGRTMPGHFDPQILEIFKDNHQIFNEIYEQMKD